MTAETEIKIKALKAFCADQDKVLMSLNRFKKSQKTAEGKKRYQYAVERAKLLKRAAEHYAEIVKEGGDDGK